MSTHEQQQVLVLNRVELGQLTATQATEMLGVSERQVRQRMIELATSTYQGCNQQSLRDLLQEREGIK